MISLAKAAADPAGRYARPDVTRLLLDRTPGDRVVLRRRQAVEVVRDVEEAGNEAREKAGVPVRQRAPVEAQALGPQPLG